MMCIVQVDGSVVCRQAGGYGIEPRWYLRRRGRQRWNRTRKSRGRLSKMNGMWIEMSTMRRCARFGRNGYEGPWQIATFLLPKRHSTVFMVMVTVTVAAAGAGSLNLKGHGGWWREGEDEGP